MLTCKPAEVSVLSCKPTEALSVVAQDNIALKRRAFQSSIWNHHNASLAVDGNTDGNFNAAQSCTATGWELSPWWAVDMGTTRHVYAVRISNRLDLSKLVTYGIKLSFVYLSCSSISAPPKVRMDVTIT